MNLLLFISLLVEFIEGAASTKIASQYTWVWQPYAAPGIMYDKIQSPDNGDLRGAKCIDMCLQLLEDGTAWCRYVLLDPYQGEWDKTVPGVHTFVERMRNMTIKECYLSTHQTMTEELSKSYYLSKGFQNKADGHVGTYVILELVTTAFNSMRWPNNLQLPVPSELRYVNELTEQYFTDTQACPWSSRTMQSSPKNTALATETSATTATTETKTSLPQEAQQRVVQYSILCVKRMRHYFEKNTCPDTSDTAIILSTNEFAAEYIYGCSMIPISSNGRSLIKETDSTKAMGWCSTKKACGLDMPLYELIEKVTTNILDTVYKTTSVTTQNVFCYVYSSSIV